MRILMTGAAGFVGSGCLRYVLRQGADPIAVDNLTQGHRQAVPGDRLVVGDVADTSLLVRVMTEHRCEAVMHFAAATYVGESVEDPEYHYRTNIGGTLSVLNAMRQAGVHRLVFSSTCATYGDNPTIPMSEDAAQDPVSPYARTKLAVEWMIRDFADAYELGFTILRYFNAAGAEPDGCHGEDHRPENHLIPLVLQVALGQREEISILGDDYATSDGTCIRDYVHIRDLGSAHWCAIQATGLESRDVFNVGTGRGHSVLDVIDACSRVTGVPIPRKIVGRRPGDAPALVADSSRLHARLGWKPQYRTIDEIVQSAWTWHRAHPGGYSD